MSMELIVDESVDAAWTRLTSDGSAITWIACTYTDSKVGTLTLKSEGTGGLPEFKDNLPDDDVIWGAFKVMGIDDRGTTISRRPKYIFVKFIPSGVASMKRAKTGGHKGMIKRVMNCAIDIEVIY
jgi:Cofilin/tropomyosin-type actin-binding protein